jgi:hypothetical protein
VNDRSDTFDRTGESPGFDNVRDSDKLELFGFRKVGCFSFRADCCADMVALALAKRTKLDTFSRRYFRTHAPRKPVEPVIYRN